MKKPGKTPGGRKRGLSQDDEDVWSQTARTLQPLKKAKSRVHTATEALELALKSDAASRSESTRSGERPQHRETLLVRERREAVQIVYSKAPALAEFDKRKARKIGAGQIAIDARIDLHGMRQGEAHAALRSFLFSAYRQGHRWVLIVTGKGARQTRDRDDPWTIVPAEPGVLRRNVPGWLDQPELRAIVISFKTASSRHGGDGALYVHLRNPERAGR